MRRLRVLVLVHKDFVPPENIDGLSDKQVAPFKTEYDVVTALEHLGHEIRILGVVDELAVIRYALHNFKPHIVFNLLEEFRGEGIYVPYILGYFELMRVPFTGCNPSGLMLADRKVTVKKILRYHRIPVPDFATFPLGRRVKRPPRLGFPLIVKSSTEHGSVGIAQASVVWSDEKLAERVAFIHDSIGTDAIGEEYVDGREIYQGILGNQRLVLLPLWEMHFSKLAEGAPKIATEKVKWDLDYRDKIGLSTTRVKDLLPGIEAQLVRLCKRVYRILGLNGYARMDIRLTSDGRLYLLEANPNPDLAYDEDFAEAANAIGIEYPALVQKILNLGMRYHKGRAE